MQKLLMPYRLQASVIRYIFAISHLSIDVQANLF